VLAPLRPVIMASATSVDERRDDDDPTSTVHAISSPPPLASRINDLTTKDAKTTKDSAECRRFEQPSGVAMLACT
jgi:hypothetical protein